MTISLFSSLSFALRMHSWPISEKSLGLKFRAGIQDGGQFSTASIARLLKVYPTLVNGCQRQTPCQAGGCGPTVHSCQFNCNQCEREILHLRNFRGPAKNPPYSGSMTTASPSP